MVQNKCRPYIDILIHVTLKEVAICLLKHSPLGIETCSFSNSDAQKGKQFCFF